MSVIYAHRANPGADITAIVTLLNTTNTKLNALLAKMDLDGTLVATDWASAIGTSDTLVLNS